MLIFGYRDFIERKCNAFFRTCRNGCRIHLAPRLQPRQLGLKSGLLCMARLALLVQRIDTTGYSQSLGRRQGFLCRISFLRFAQAENAAFQRCNLFVQFPDPFAESLCDFNLQKTQLAQFFQCVFLSLA